MKPFRLAVGVPADVQSAYDFYAQRSGIAAERFLAAYLLTRDQIVARPLLWRLRSPGWRHSDLSALLDFLPRKESVLARGRGNVYG